MPIQALASTQAPHSNTAAQCLGLNGGFAKNSNGSKEL